METPPLRNKRSAVGPNRPTVDPFSQLLGDAQSLHTRGLKSTTSEEGQGHIRELDKFLKDLAELQSRVGFYRKEVGNHVSTLRQAKPKGKPAEGEIRKLLDGSEVAFFDGKWIGINRPPAKEESN